MLKKSKVVVRPDLVSGRTSRFTALAASAVAIALAQVTPSSVRAANVTWDANGATANQTDGAGGWLAANQWWNGTTNTTWNSGDDATFGVGGAGGAVTLASPTSVGSLIFNYFTGTYTLGTAGQAITLNNGITKNTGSGVATVISPLILGGAQTWTNNSVTNLNVQAATTVNGALTIDGSGITSFDNANAVISGAGGIIKNGTGHLVLSGAATPLHTFTGDITVNGGSIGFQSSAFLTGRNVNLANGYLGGRFSSGFTWTGGLGTGANQIQITGGVSGFSGEGSNGSTFQIGTALSTLVWGSANFNPTVLLANGDARMNANGKGALNNGIDLNGANRTITSLQTTDGAATSGFTINGVVSNSTGTAGIIKTGIGNLILIAANTYNGATTINAGSITLSGSGTINSSSALNLVGGTLRLVNTAQVNRFADGAPVTVSAGGSISYENTSGTAVYTETIGATTVNGGLLNLVQNTNQAGTGSQTLTIGTSGSSNLSQSGTGSVAFSAATTGPQASGNKNMFVVFGAGTTAANEIIGPWATTGTAAATQTDYAVYNSNFVVPAAITGSVESTWSTAHATTSNYTMANASGVATTLTATRNINSLRANSSTGTPTVDIATDFITLTGHTFSNGDVIAFGGTAPTGTTTGTAYYVRDVSGSTFKVSLTSGGTAIDLTAAGTPNITGGITLSSGNNLGTYGILNAGASGLAIGTSGSGVVTLPTASPGSLYVTPGNGAAITIAAPIANNTASGVLTLVKNGSATLRLDAPNTYTGDTVINAGTLQIGTNGLANGANLGSGNYAGNIFIAAGATLNVQTNSNQTFSGVISGDGALVKINTGTLILSGANTYTGKTSLSSLTTTGSGTLVVSSFNSVNGGTPLLASSSLGAPTTVANGTIDLGSGTTQSPAILQYVGTGETTDRVINFPFNGTATRTLDASGSGLLKFTSTFTSNGTTTSSVALQGTGSGEIVNGLPFTFNNLTKSGGGTWTLGGLSGHTGTTTVSAGTLISTNPALAFGTNPSGITIAAAGTLSLRNDSSVSFTNGSNPYNIANSASGATINVDRVSGTGSNTITVGNLTTTSTAGSWNLNFTGGNGVSLNAGTLTTPVSTIAATHTITNNITGGGSLILASVLDAATTIANPVLVFTGTGNTTVTGAITQTQASQALTKNGGGTLTLSGISAYTGATTVSAGMLIVNGTLTASPVTVQLAGKLGGSGTLGSTLTVAGTLAPGNSPGVLSTGTLLLASTANTILELNGTNLLTPEYDQVNVTGGVTLGGNLALSIGYVPALLDSFTIINNDAGDAVTLPFATINGVAATGGLAGDSFVIGLNTFSIDYAGGTGNDVVLTVTGIVPEPTAVGLLSIGTLGLLARRRRKAI